MQLHNGSRVVIVGGGPAGSFAALHLLRLARARGLSLRVTILEPRDFRLSGLGGCNKCAGILSSALVRKLAALDLTLPPEVVQSRVDTYVLHAGSSQIPIHVGDPARQVLTVYRGGGPRLGQPPYPASFDFWLLSQARACGAELLKTRALSVRAGPPPSVEIPAGRLEADLVVLAIGVNGRLQIDPALGYVPPRTEVMAQDEIPLPDESFQGKVHIFFDYPRGLIFGALIPKNRYLNISLLGHALPPDAVAQFIGAHNLEQDLASAFSLCGCEPRISISSARGYYSDGFVAVGDASVTRLYKDGIGSAFATAEAAALCALDSGISRADFARAFAPACLRIQRDNDFGRLLFGLWAFTRQNPFLRRAWVRALETEADLPPQRRVHTRILWGMFSGDETYRSMFWRLASLPSVLSVSRRALPIP